jgi:electron transport complex protein RnfE
MDTQTRKSQLRLSDGLVRQNIVLMSGTAIAPVAACAVNFQNALALSVGFTVIAFFGVFLCRFVPKKIVYTIRVIIYALIAGLAFIPAYLAVSVFYGTEVAQGLGVYLPVLAVNPLILTKTETRFSLRPAHLMTLELAGYITGFNVVCLLVGIARDIFTNGRIGNFEVYFGFAIPALSATFGGLITVGITAGLFRWLYNQSKARKAKKLEKELERQRMIEEL